MSASHLKRKRDDFDDSDDDEVSLGRQVLPVANLPQDFAGEPEDGLQYLFTVRRDARQRPHITRVHNPYDKPDPIIPRSSSTPAAAHPSLPSLKWRQQYASQFRNFCKNASQSTIHVTAAPPGKLMPHRKERDHWWAFLAGKPESDWNPPKKPKQNRTYTQTTRAFADDPGVAYGTPSSSKQDEDIPGGETWRINEDGEVELAQTLEYSEEPAGGDPTPPPVAPKTDATPNEGSKGREPTPILLRHIDERTALHLLMYFAHWMNLYLEEPETSTMIPTESHARWIFALLSRVEDHVSADDMSHLRSLARACISLIKVRLSTSGTSTSSSKVDMMSTTSCWMTITTIAELWAQRDLWVDAGEMLQSISTAEAGATD
ncbi:hypothetical protein PLEOSDRAFT_1040169 [Pleurotus ostreatus PC15]|uniref:Uncharacterized protein n=1 Tax=Pleurotus ostreatus (strain PC15) TaxID=1137138 RepID=A0A067NNH7_PLEO1|nr:hypothetical protein PLEOSDRAFT_1040169 [Pleurotus ostreatus PC15]